MRNSEDTAGSRFSMSTMDITLKGILPLTALAEPAVG